MPEAPQDPDDFTSQSPKNLDHVPLILLSSARKRLVEDNSSAVAALSITQALLQNSFTAYRFDESLATFRAMGLRSAEMSTSLLRRSTQENGEIAHFGDFKFFRELQDGTTVQQDMLS